jgi:hypothetical protein
MVRKKGTKTKIAEDEDDDSYGSSDEEKDQKGIDSDSEFKEDPEDNFDSDDHDLSN